MQLDSRMSMVIRALCNGQNCVMPAEFVFLGGDKLDIPGSRWAPRRWLSRHEILLPDPLEAPTPAIKLHGRGLEIEFPGLQLRWTRRITNTVPRTRFIRFPTNDSLVELFHLEMIGEDEYFPWESIVEEQSLYVITRYLPLKNPKEIALLVRAVPPEAGIYYSQILGRVWLSREPVRNVGEFQDPFRESCLEDESSAFWGVILADTTRWCVDGRSNDPFSNYDTPLESPQDLNVESCAYIPDRMTNDPESMSLDPQTTGSHESSSKPFQSCQLQPDTARGNAVLAHSRSVRADDYDNDGNEGEDKESI